MTDVEILSWQLAAQCTEVLLAAGAPDAALVSGGLTALADAPAGNLDAVAAVPILRWMHRTAVATGPVCAADMLSSGLIFPKCRAVSADNQYAKVHGSNACKIYLQEVFRRKASMIKCAMTDSGTPS